MLRRGRERCADACDGWGLRGVEAPGAPPWLLMVAHSTEEEKRGGPYALLEIRDFETEGSVGLRQDRS
jgi:hypothetical protein